MTIRVGMIGAGAIARNHCRDIANYKGAEVVCVADLSEARRAEIALNFNIPKNTARWEDVVADRKIDAVSIALPTSLHAPVALAALKAGKHVHLDKPFAMNMREAKQVVAAAKKSGKVFMVGMNRRYDEKCQKLRHEISRGTLGDIYHTRAFWCRRAGSPRFGTWFVNKKLAGGGCLLDIGVHALDGALFLIDNWEPVSVTGKVTTTFGHKGIGEGGWGKSDPSKSIKFDVDDGAFAFIKFRNGATLELAVSWIRHQKDGDSMGVEIYGTKAFANLETSEICRPVRGKGREYEIVAPREAPKAVKRTTRMTDFLDAINGRRKPLCTPAQALVVQGIIDAIYKSSETGREVRLG